MKRNKLVKAISFLLMFAMLTPLIGCSKDNKGTTTKTNGDSAKEEKMGYPIVTDKSVTLRYWHPFSAAQAAAMNNIGEHEVYKEMEKVTGLKIEFMHPGAGNAGEQFNLLIASGDIPDIMQEADNYKGGITKGIDDGIFLDMTPLVQKYAPDFYKLVNSSPDVRRQNTYAGGKYYTFNRTKPDDEIPFKRLSTRQDWLDEAGIQVPKTIAEWEAYLKFIADKKPGVAPYILIKNGVEPMFLGAWNGVPGFFLKEGKKVDYGNIQPEFKEYLTLMNKWYSYGYIKKDFANIADAAALKEYGNGKAGVIEQAVGPVGAQAKTSGFPHASAPFPRLKVGDQLHWFNADWKSTGGETAISKTSKYQAEAMRWMNYAYTEDGKMLFNYGIKDNYTIVNGKAQFKWDYINNHPKYPKETVETMIRLHQGPKWCLPDLDCNIGVLKGGQETIDIRTKWSDDKNVDNKYLLPPQRLTIEEADKRNAIMEDVNNYVNGMIIKFISGAEPLSKFDEYVAQVKKMGIEDAIKITQDAYDRYMAQ